MTSRASEPGWTRIGRLDDANRRALWIRESPGVVELCSGRDGEDAYVKITDEHTQFRDLEDVLSRARFAVEYAPEHERTIEEAIARVCDAAGVADANDDGERMSAIERIRLLDEKIQAIEMARDVAGAERTRAHDVLDSMSVTASPSLEQRIHELSRRPAHMLAHMARLLGVPEQESEAAITGEAPAVAVASKLVELVEAETHRTIEYRMREAMAAIEKADTELQRHRDEAFVEDERVQHQLGMIKSKHRVMIRKMRAQLADLHGQIDAYEHLLQEHGL